MKKRKIGMVRSVLQTILSPVASALSGFVGTGYNATDPRRKVIDRSQMFANRASANQLLNGSLSQLRTYCRHLERNNPTARAGSLALDALIVGTGIDLAPETGHGEDVDNQVRDMFNDWMRIVGVNGCDIYELQHLAVRELPTAGEWLWRIVPSGIDEPIPLRVLPLEGEWLAEDNASAPANGCTLAAGIELDKYGRPVAYYLAPPEMGKPEKVPASSIIHGFEIKRPLQARGEPWLTPVIETLMNERDLVDAELKAAAITASIGIAVESEAHPGLDDTEGTDDPVQSVGLGSVVRLYPGEKVHAFGHTRPSQQIAPFRQMLRGDIAAALRIPQRFLDRDVSRANYSSMRADMLDTQRLLSPMRELAGHRTIGALYKVAAPFLSAMVGKYIDPNKYRLLPDGQPYVDPVKDIGAATEAIAAGLSTFEAEIGARGGDYRQVWKQLAKEQKEAAALGVKLGLSATNAPAPQSSAGAVATDPNKTPPQDAEQEDADAEDDTEEGEDMKRSEFLLAMRAMQPAPQAPVTVEQRIVMDAESAEIMGRAIGKNQPAPVVNVPQQAPAVVHVAAPEVRIEQAAQAAPSVVVQVPQQAAPVVNVSPTSVTIENEITMPSRTVKATPQRDGSVLMVPQE
jgi:lambda family phage portal protein